MSETDRPITTNGEGREYHLVLNPVQYHVFKRFLDITIQEAHNEFSVSGVLFILENISEQLEEWNNHLNAKGEDE